jgi:hypothetical protein
MIIIFGISAQPAKPGMGRSASWLNDPDCFLIDKFSLQNNAITWVNTKLPA